MCDWTFGHFQRAKMCNVQMCDCPTLDELLLLYSRVHQLDTFFKFVLSQVNQGSVKLAYISLFECKG